MSLFRPALLGALSILFVSSALAQTPEERTKRALDLLLARQYKEVYALFSPEMKNALTLADYSAGMEQILALAPLRSQEPPIVRVIPTDHSTLVTIPLHFALGSLDYLVSWNQAGQIQGTWFRPPQPKWETPAYSKPDSFRTRELTVGDGEWKLPALLAVPTGKGPFPAVVLVHGSGPNDRDESVGAAKVFRDLAEGLASRGVAALRYEKRTRVYPQKCAADPNFTMNQETVDDAVAAAALLRSQEGIDPRRVFVLGHSQGGYMVPRILKLDPKLAGAIVLAGNVRPLEELVLEQIEYAAQLKGKLSDAERAQLESVRRNPWLALPLPEKYRQDLKGYDPAAEAKRLDAPMLVLQGERDYQVSMKDFALWKAALGGRKNAAFRSYPALNHLFIAGEGKGTPAEYSKPGHVAEDVVADVASWIVSGALP